MFLEWSTSLSGSSMQNREKSEKEFDEPVMLEENRDENSKQQEVVREEQEAMSAVAQASEAVPEAQLSGAAESESIESLNKKIQSYWDQILRLQAEFANYRKRTEREKAEAIRFGRDTMIERMVSLVDVMEEALKHSQNAKDIASLKKGFEMVVQECLSFMKSEGAEPLKTVGELFDPHLHDAVEQVHTDKKEENNLILQEIQKGYTLNGRLLRPAKVKVAKLNEKKEEQ